MDSKLFVRKHTGYESEDLLYGKIGKTDVSISEVKVVNV
ncbi:MAG: hypothetical protein ACI9TH_003734 [Kiritimatiellia bacterium]|jgi:hypothetical protein